MSVLEPFQLPFVQHALVEILVLSLAAGLVGTWIVLRGLAFYAHAVGTAAFPGLVLADGLGFAAPVGAVAAVLVFAGLLGVLAARRHAEYDSLTALVLVGALAVGVVLASDVFHSGAEVENLLFGSLLVTSGRDVALGAAVGLLALLLTFLLGRRWAAIGFDQGAARALGLRSRVWDGVLLVLVGLAAVAALSAVGALLASALLVVPAATVRLFARRLLPWQVATVALAAFEGAAGLWLSAETNAPPGGTIAAIGGGIFAIAALARSARGRTVLAAAGAAVLLGGCGIVTNSGGRLAVVATTTQLGDFARAVGGPDVAVHQILQPNTDPHAYEPRPLDVAAVASAKVVLENGDALDGWMGKVVSESGGHPRVVDVGAAVPFRLPGQATGSEAARYDPHWWHDPRNARAAVERIRAALVAAEPSRGAAFDRRAASYVARLRALDARIAACFARVPAARRRLVTDHDAFGYFARRYGIQVVGAVIPSQSTEAQPSARSVARLVDVVKREHVRAIFPESSINAKLAKAIARETGASADTALYGDTLGSKGSSGATYLAMEAANAEAMVRGFTGGATRCRS